MAPEATGRLFQAAPGSERRPDRQATFRLKITTRTASVLTRSLLPGGSKAPAGAEGGAEAAADGDRPSEFGIGHNAGPLWTETADDDDLTIPAFLDRRVRQGS